MAETITDKQTHVDFSTAVSSVKERHEEDAASTPTLSGYTKEKAAELYFNTEESKTNAATTPRQMRNEMGVEAPNASHMKTPKMSNMRHLLGNLTDELASPEHALKHRTPGQTRTPGNKVQQQHTPGQTETPMPKPPVRVPVNDSSSSSSGKAGSNSVSSDTSSSIQGLVMIKEAYMETAQSCDTAPARKPYKRTPGTQQAAVANRLLARPQHSKPQAPHAIKQLRDAEPQDNFEFPPLSTQKASINGGVIWNLDTPAEHEGTQQESKEIQQPVSAHQCPSKRFQYSSGLADPWDMAPLSKQLPAEHFNVSAGPGVPPQLHERFLQQVTASQSPPVGSSYAAGPNNFQSQLLPMSNMPARRSFYGSQNAHTAVVQDDSGFYDNVQDMPRMQSSYMSAGMVTNQPQFTPPPLYTIPEAAVAKPTMQTSQPAWQAPPFAGVPSLIPVMRDGRPYMRNGVPVRIPLQDTTNILEGQDIQRITTMCYVHASKGQFPANVDKRTVKQLVQQQIEARKPIRAPWYREGLRSSRSYNTKGMQPPAPQQQHSLASGHLKSNMNGPNEPSSSRQAERTSEHNMTQGTDCFIPSTGRMYRLPRDSRRLSAGARDFEGSSAAHSAYSAAANSRHVPGAVQAAGGRSMAVGTCCFIPSA